MNLIISFNTSLVILRVYLFLSVSCCSIRPAEKQKRLFKKLEQPLRALFWFHYFFLRISPGVIL